MYSKLREISLLYFFNFLLLIFIGGSFLALLPYFLPFSFIFIINFHLLLCLGSAEAHPSQLARLVPLFFV